MGTATREFKKQHSGSIERVSEYRSIGYASIGYEYGWVSEVSVIHRCELLEIHGSKALLCFPYLLSTPYLPMP